MLKRHNEKNKILLSKATNGFLYTLCFLKLNGAILQMVFSTYDKLG